MIFRLPVKLNGKSVWFFTFFVKIHHIPLCEMEFMFFEVYIVYGQTEFPFRKPFETEFTIFPNGKGTFLKRKITTPMHCVRSWCTAALRIGVIISIENIVKELSD